jgi:hypothetical protein
MKPIDFEQANMTFMPPKEMTDDQCGAMRVACVADPDGLPCLISCHQPTIEERAAILAGKPVWLWVIGSVMPPVLVTTDNPFRMEREHAQADGAEPRSNVIPLRVGAASDGQGHDEGEPGPGQPA